MPVVEFNPSIVKYPLQKKRFFHNCESIKKEKKNTADQQQSGHKTLPITKKLFASNQNKLGLMSSGVRGVSTKLHKTITKGVDS